MVISGNFMFKPTDDKLEPDLFPAGFTGYQYQPFNVVDLMHSPWCPEEKFRIALANMLTRSDVAQIMSMGLSPPTLIGLPLPHALRERLIVGHLHAASAGVAFRSSQYHLNCGRALLPEDEPQAYHPLRCLVHILTRINLLISGYTLDPNNQLHYKLDPDINIGHLHVWIALTEAQEKLEQGHPEAAWVRIEHLNPSYASINGLVPVSPSFALQDGRGELFVLKGLIHFWKKRYDEARDCLQNALLSNLNKISEGFVKGFLWILHLSYPCSFGHEPPRPQSSEQDMLEVQDHRVIFWRLMQCLVYAVEGDTRFFEEKINPIAGLLQGAGSTAASAFLNDIVRIARAVVLYRRLGVQYDLQTDLQHLEAECPLHIWVVPVVEYRKLSASN